MLASKWGDNPDYELKLGGMGISIPVFGMVNIPRYTGISRYSNYKSMPVQVPGSRGLNKLDYIHKDCKGQQQQNSRFLARHHAKLNSLPDIASPSR